MVWRNITLNLPETSLLHVLWRKCRTCSRSLFFNAAHFYLALVAASISHFLTAITKFGVVLPTKKCLLCFLSLALDLCRSFSRWPAAYVLFFAVFVLLYISNLWSKLNTLDNTDTETISTFRFRLY